MGEVIDKMGKSSSKKYGFVLEKMILIVIFCWSWMPVSQATDDLCEPGSGKVARAMFTTMIDNREPKDRVLILENNTKELYFFSDLRHLQGQNVKHRWEYEGRVIKEKSFQVKGPRWRVFSQHKLDNNMLGRWTVVVTDERGCPLKAVIFQYIQAGKDGNGSAIVDLQ